MNARLLISSQHWASEISAGSLCNLVMGCQVFLMMWCRFMKVEEDGSMSETLALLSKNVRWERALWLLVRSKGPNSSVMSPLWSYLKFENLHWCCCLLLSADEKTEAILGSWCLLAGFNMTSYSTYATLALAVHTRFLCLCSGPLLLWWRHMSNCQQTVEAVQVYISVYSL